MTSTDVTEFDRAEPEAAAAARRSGTVQAFRPGPPSPRYRGHSRKERSGATAGRRLAAFVLAAAALLTGAVGLAGSAQASGPVTPNAVGAYYQIENLLSQKCVDVIGKSLLPNVRVHQWKCHNDDNQLWAPVDGMLVNRNSGLCLDVQSDVAAVNGTRLQQFWCHSEFPSEHWQFVPSSTPNYSYVVNVSSGLCLDLKNGTGDDGGVIRLWQCTGGSDQKWRLS